MYRKSTQNEHQNEHHLATGIPTKHKLTLWKSETNEQKIEKIFVNGNSRHRKREETVSHANTNTV